MEVQNKVIKKDGEPYFTVKEIKDAMVAGQMWWDASRYYTSWDKMHEHLSMRLEIISVGDLVNEP